MSFLDKLTKAVSDTVDRGKKEVDEFMRIQKVKGEIGESERRMQEATNQVQQAMRQIGEKAVAMMRSGALVQPELQALAEPIGGFERQIEAERRVIVAKNAEIERIKAEGQAPAPPASPVAAPPPAPAATAGASPVEPPPIPPPPAARHMEPPPLPPPPVVLTSCPQCGKPANEGAAFCGECGAKLR